MILKNRLHQQAKIHNIKWETIEQDYILSWVLEGISSIELLQKNLVFKGGTALKKIYFGNYRFSQDLDFSVINGSDIYDKLAALINEACDIATSKIQDLNEHIEIKAEQYLEKKPHPEGQQAFVIRAKMPWHREFHTTVYAEISFQELIILPPNQREIIHPYGENLQGKILVYPLEEIIAEKIRALLQFARKLHERGWARSRVRDYYDLWRIIQDYKDKIDWALIPHLIKKKCDYKSVIYNSIEDIFQDNLMRNVSQEWEPWLSDVVTKLPEYKEVIASLKTFLGNNL